MSFFLFELLPILFMVIPLIGSELHVVPDAVVQRLILPFVNTNGSNALGLTSQRNQRLSRNHTIQSIIMAHYGEAIHVLDLIVEQFMDQFAPYHLRQIINGEVRPSLARMLGTVWSQGSTRVLVFDLESTLCLSGTLSLKFYLTEGKLIDALLFLTVSTPNDTHHAVYDVTSSFPALYSWLYDEVIEERDYASILRAVYSGMEFTIGVKKKVQPSFIWNSHTFIRKTIGNQSKI